MKVDDIENKLDTLIDMYKDDRQQQKRYYDRNHQLHSSDSFQSGSSVFPPPPTTTTTTTFAGEQRLLERTRHHRVANDPLRLRSSSNVASKQLSEPSTPIVKNPVKPMMRNLSDLGPRIQKRVTIGGTGCSYEVLYEQPMTSSLLYPIVDGSQVEGSSPEDGDETSSVASRQDRNEYAGRTGSGSGKDDDEEDGEGELVQSSSGSSLCRASETSTVELEETTTNVNANYSQSQFEKRFRLSPGRENRDGDATPESERQSTTVPRLDSGSCLKCGQSNDICPVHTSRDVLDADQSHNTPPHNVPPLNTQSLNSQTYNAQPLNTQSSHTIQPVNSVT